MKVLFTLFFITAVFWGVNVVLPSDDNVAAPEAQTVAIQENPPATIPQTSVSVAEINAIHVSVPGKLDLIVDQQPTDNAGFVTNEYGAASQFRPAAQYGTVGILAHSYLSGSKFFNVQVGDQIIVTFDSGQVAAYSVTRIEQYQALSPTSTMSDFIDLQTGQRLTASQLFSRVYGSGNRVVLQTCIEVGGDPSWGRLFVIAEPGDS